MLNAPLRHEIIMITFSLNTFIKISLLDTGGRISEIQKRLTSASGYDFYKPLQKAVRLHSSGLDDEAIDTLLMPANEIEKKYNQEAFNTFKTKFGSNRSLCSVNESKVIKFSSAGIAIKIDPLFIISKSGNEQVYSLWPTQKPQLTQRYGAVACYLMRSAYANSGLGNRPFFFANLIDNKVYSEKQITNNTNLILKADVNSIGTLVKEL
jgi:hypothetical protein